MGVKRLPKLSVNMRLHVCMLLATGYNPQRVCDILEDEYGIRTSHQNIRENYLNSKRWQKIILRYQRERDRQVLKHSLAKTINRLNILQDAINEAFTWRLDKIYYDKDGNELSRVEKRNIGMIAQLIREARTEIEGEKPPIDQSKHYHLTTVVQNLHAAAKKHNKAEEEIFGTSDNPAKNRLRVVR